MRKLIASMTLLATAVLGALALVVPAAPAGAQPLTCTFLVLPTTLTGPRTVQVSGVAPGTTNVTVLVDGSPVTTVSSSPGTGAWGPVSVAINVTSQISIQLPQVYAALPCTGNGGANVVRVEVAGQIASLPRTGSETRQYVFIGSALLAVGLVLFVGARRRRDVHGRS